MGTITKLSAMYNVAKAKWPQLENKQKRNIVSDIFMLIVCIAGMFVFDSWLIVAAYAVGIVTALVSLYAILINNLPEDMLKQIFGVDLIVTTICFSLYTFFIGIYWLAAVCAALGLISLYKGNE